MKSLKVLSVVFFLVATVSAQYNYHQPQDDAEGYQYNQPTQPPTLPPKGYLPPTTTHAPYVPPTKNPYVSETEISPEGRPAADDTDHAPGMPYDFTYAVKDDYGNDFAHKADSDGEVVKGEYRTLLPDGRMQIVKYTADWKNGYNAEVTYDGEATYPEPKPIPTRPVPTRPPTKGTPDEFEEDVDSQGFYPSKAPPTTQPPFRCYPGSTDYRCPQPTTTQPPFRCYPGSTDYRCPQPTTTQPPICYPGNTDYRCPQPTTQPPFRCYPGSTDYRCPQPTTTQPPRCYPGSYDTRCPQPTTTYRPPTQRTTQPPVEPPGLYGAPSLPFGVRNNAKFGYNNRK